MKWLRFEVLVLLSVGSLAWAAEEQAQRPHIYAFDQPELLATQRAFGVGNAVTLIGEACANDEMATASYVRWSSANQVVLQEMTILLATHYRISPVAGELQKRVAENMHLKTHLMLSDAMLSDACASLPDTLALPAMNLMERYQSLLAEVKNPDYLKLHRPAGAMTLSSQPQSEPGDKTNDREEPTRFE